MDALDLLGEDLALLSVSPDDGRVTTAGRIGFGLMGSELVRLAAAGRLTITSGRVTVTDRSPCPDPLLDVALASLAGFERGVRAKGWVSRPRRGSAGPTWNGWRRPACSRPSGAPGWESSP